MGDEVKSLRHWRAERALGLKELAARAGVSHSTILRIERGETLSQARVYRKLAQALGIEPLQIAEYRQLMGLEQEASPTTGSPPAARLKRDEAEGGCDEQGR